MSSCREKWHLQQGCHVLILPEVRVYQVNAIKLDEQSAAPVNPPRYCICVRLYRMFSL